MRNLNRHSILAAIATTICCSCTVPPAPASVGTAAPAYSGVTLNGDSLRLASLRPAVVLLNVWATWCIPCRRELPELQALHQQYSARGLRVVGVSVDESGADADIADFVKSFGLTYTIMHDPQGRVSSAFGNPGVPASILIDRKGIVRWRHLGPFQATDPRFLAALKQTL